MVCAAKVKENRLRPVFRPALLGVQPLSDPPPYSEVEHAPQRLSDVTNGLGCYGYEDTDPHPDERQIKLDTDRSFVLYPLGEKPTLVSWLNDLKVSQNLARRLEMYSRMVFMLSCSPFSGNVVLSIIFRAFTISYLYFFSLFLNHSILLV